MTTKNLSHNNSETRQNLIVAWIDDNDSVLDVVTCMFEGGLIDLKTKPVSLAFHGYSSGKKFLDSVNSGKQPIPDIIFTDINMPFMDGVDLLRSVRLDPRFERTLCVSVTAYVKDEIDDNYLHEYVGFDLTLHKPLTLAGVVECLEFLVSYRNEIIRSPRKLLPKLFDIIYKTRIEHKSLERYIRSLIDPAVYEALRSDPDNVTGIRRVEASIGFVDIRGFTRLAAETEPEDLAVILNTFFEDVSGLITRTPGASIDKFIGDCIMWTVGAVKPVDTHEWKAYLIASSIIDFSKQLNSELTNRLGVEYDIAFGIGLASGPVSVGLVGAEGPRMQYTVFGPTVNLASRLCDKASPHEILIGGRIATTLKTQIELEPVEEIAVEGFPRRVKIFSAIRETPSKGSSAQKAGRLVRTLWRKFHVSRKENAQ